MAKCEHCILDKILVNDHIDGSLYEIESNFENYLRKSAASDIGLPCD